MFFERKGNIMNECDFRSLFVHMHAKLGRPTLFKHSDLSKKHGS